MQALRRYLVTGLLVWVPIAITLWVISSVVAVLDRSLAVLPAELQPEVLLGFSLPGIGALFTLAIIWLTGLVTANMVGQSLMRWWEGLLRRIPFFNSIYSSVKQVSDTLLSSSGKAFRKAVLVPFPGGNTKAIGFLTGEVSPGLANGLDEGYVSVFIPTAPNPTAGFVLLVLEKDLIELNLSVDEALKYAVSMGVVAPSLSSTDK
ncbi:MAG: DUF502 domain-containing protein [Burkholderiales bacterium]|nr:DUF502 domain-containing protein [Burkholderiales bacterium]